ncbi:unnamed protein product, partial [Mesorhabditis belari]|uniref:Neurotransmitter-gated ion-channel ligand-binding domain-containing protein n=1 Tax=Mesorhabditis belari TaxID=2138241 RepID=A0AAF3EQ39_9BILA
MNVRVFPFDTQKCEIGFSVETYGSDFVTATGETASHLDDSIYDGNGEWEVLDIKPSKKIYSSYNAKEQEYEYIKFTLRLKRRPHFYIYVIVLPCFMLTLLSIVGMFWNAHIKEEKLTKLSIGLTSMMSMTLLLDMMAQEIPKNATFPLLGFYVIISIGIIALGCAITITIFDVVTALFGPIFINSLSGVYLIGFFRLSTYGTYVFMIFFYILMCLQSGALVIAFTAKLYSLLPIAYRAKLKFVFLLYIGSFYGLIPVGVTFLFYVWSTDFEKYSQLMFLTDVITFAIPYISYIFAQIILVVFGWSWVAQVEKYAIPCLSILSNTHSGITSLVVLTTSRPYFVAVSSILKLKIPKARLNKLTSYVYNEKVFFARNQNKPKPKPEPEAKKG